MDKVSRQKQQQQQQLRSHPQKHKAQPAFKTSSMTQTASGLTVWLGKKKDKKFPPFFQDCHAHDLGITLKHIQSDSKFMFVFGRRVRQFRITDWLISSRSLRWFRLSTEQVRACARSEIVGTLNNTGTAQKNGGYTGLRARYGHTSRNNYGFPKQSVWLDPMNSLIKIPELLLEKNQWRDGCFLFTVCRYSMVVSSIAGLPSTPS